MAPVRRPSPFLEQVRATIRVRHYSIRTEESYLFWVRRFILFHGKRHPRELGQSQVGEFLTHLAVDRKVSASTQNQALNALVFLYKAVLEPALGDRGVVSQPDVGKAIVLREETGVCSARAAGVRSRHAEKDP